MRQFCKGVCAAMLFASGPCSAQLTPQWLTVYTPPQGPSVGPAGYVVDAAGNTYIAGRTGSSSNQDVLVVKIDPAGEVAWAETYNGPGNWHDHGSGVALSPDGTIVVAGNTPGAGSYADALLLKFDAQSGALIWDRRFDGGPFTSDSIGSVAVDATGSIYAVGGTVGDGGDALIVKYSAAGEYRWHKVFDGPSAAPYSQDNYIRVMLDPSGDPIALGRANMANLQNDWVITRYAAADGAVVWQTFHGDLGGDTPNDMVMDAAGDVYITGLFFASPYNRAGTIRVRNSDGQIAWSKIDSIGPKDFGAAIALSAGGQVAIAIRSDPDGNLSNFNDNIYIVGREAATGEPLWTYSYGANCVGCFDVPYDAVVDAAGNLFVAGETSSPPYSNSGILFQLNAATGAEVDRFILAPVTGEYTRPQITLLDAAQNLYMAGIFGNSSTGHLDIFEAKFAARGGAAVCYPNCDGSTAVPVLNIADFACFLQKFAAGDPYANCDQSTAAPMLNVADFSCFLQAFAQGCG